MDFNEFKEQFTEDVKQGLADAGIEAKVSTNTVEKMNESYEAMTVTPEGSNVGVNVNMEKFFEAYENGTDYEAVATLGYSRPARRARQGDAQHRICLVAPAHSQQLAPTRIHHRRSLRILADCLSACQRQNLTLTHDFFPPNGEIDIHRTTLSCLHNNKK